MTKLHSQVRAILSNNVLTSFGRYLQHKITSSLRSDVIFTHRLKANPDNSRYTDAEGELNIYYHATERPTSIGTRVHPELTIIKSRYGSFKFIISSLMISAFYSAKRWRSWVNSREKVPKPFRALLRCMITSGTGSAERSSFLNNGQIWVWAPCRPWHAFEKVVSTKLYVGFTCGLHRGPFNLLWSQLDLVPFGGHPRR